MTERDAEALVRLLEGATPGPWVYRPNEYDDWGWIRGPEKDSDIGRYRPIVANARNSDVTREQEDEHRRNKTDPYGPNAELIVAAVNALPGLLAHIAGEAGRREAAWRDGFNEARRSLSDDDACDLTVDVEDDAWADSKTAALGLRTDEAPSGGAK